MGRILIGSLKGKDGDSAYQVAVRNGYQGTEAQWVAFLESGGLLDPITGLPAQAVVDALSDAVLEEHENDPTPHPKFELSLLDSYKLGKL
jgi:hypothetical protein